MCVMNVSGGLMTQHCTARFRNKTFLKSTESDLRFTRRIDEDFYFDITAVPIQ